jgi:hypothetical protein
MSEVATDYVRTGPSPLQDARSGTDDPFVA